MILSLRSLIIHPFLFAIFPIVLIFSFIYELPINYLALLILLISVVIFLLLILLRWLFKDDTKAGMVLETLTVDIINKQK